MLKARLQEDLKQAMLSGDKPLVEILRSLKSAILYKEVAAGKREEGLSDEEILNVLKKEYSSRNEAAEMYRQAADDSRAEHEEYQATVIKSYLPEEMSEEAIQQIINTVLAELAISEPTIKDMGKIMGAVKAKAGSAADNSLVARLVKERIDTK